MRVKTLNQAYLKFEFPSSSIKEVRRYWTKYAALNQLLLEVPELVDLAHATARAAQLPSALPETPLSRTQGEEAFAVHRAQRQE